jgi:hypothetical protein
MVLVSAILAFSIYMLFGSDGANVQHYGSAACSGSGCAGKPGMLPILDPAFNIHEMVAQMLLLEDHLNNDNKLCEDCIFKHATILYAFMEECLGLDTKDKYKTLVGPMPYQVREIQRRLFMGHIQPSDAAKEIRKMRKKLMPHLKDLYGEKYTGIVTTTSGSSTCTSCKL